MNIIGRKVIKNFDMWVCVNKIILGDVGANDYSPLLLITSPFASYKSQIANNHAHTGAGISLAQ